MENVPLSDLEKRMMYFTESDATSCADPIELNDEFEAQYNTAEYEVKISRLLQHAYARLRAEDPERKRNWDQAIRALREGDHYFLVMWDAKFPSEHRVRDSFKLLGAGLLVATALGIAFFWAAQHNISEDQFRKYFLIVLVGGILIGSGLLRAIYRAAVVSVHRRSTKNDHQN